MPASSPRQSGAMIAVDTNIVVRYLTGDHPRQSTKARTLVDGNDAFLSRTVILECEWVLRSAYRNSPREICRKLRAFTGLPTVFTEDHPFVARALDLAEDGMDFADALHLGAATSCEYLATFDEDFVKRAKRAGIDNVARA